MPWYVENWPLNRDFTVLYSRQKWVHFSSASVKSDRSYAPIDTFRTDARYSWLGSRGCTNFWWSTVHLSTGKWPRKFLVFLYLHLTKERSDNSLTHPHKQTPPTVLVWMECCSMSFWNLSSRRHCSYRFKKKAKKTRHNHIQQHVTRSPRHTAIYKIKLSRCSTQFVIGTSTFKKFPRAIIRITTVIIHMISLIEICVLII